MNRLAVVTVLAAASLAVAAPALAGDKPHPDTTHKQVCHPTGKGYVLINPAQASSHIDERTGAPKHEHDGRVDVYAVNGVCPAVSTPSPTTTRSTPSTTSPPTSPTTSQPTETSATSSPSSTPTATMSPTGPQSTTTAHPTTSTRPPSSSPSTSTAISSPRSTHSVRPSATPTPAESSPPAPPELARTGVEAYYLLTLGGILLVGGAFIHLARKGGAHR